jgi:hypothetical protein
MNLSYTLTRPPKAIRKARLDNLALVSANMLPLKDSYQPIANNLPQGSVLICDAPAKPRLQAILSNVAQFFRARGHQVRTLTGPLA